MMKIVALVVLLAVVVSAEFAPLLHAENANVIPGSYIVVLKDGTDILDRDAHILDLQATFMAAADAECDVTFRYNLGKELVGFAARLSKNMLQQQLAHPNVKYIEADQVMSINYNKETERAPLASITQSGATWGLARVSKRDLPLATTYLYNSIAGENVDVYVVDTGILTTHTDFGTRAVSVYNAVTAESPVDLNGHGTHCAGTIGGTTYGIAKKVSLKAVKVLSASGSGTTAGVIAGVDYVRNNRNVSRSSVGSMSLGGGASTTLDSAVTSAISSGVQFAIAAGNDNANACNYSPAKVATAVTVGATTNTDARSSFSNIGTCVSLFAPGTSITSDWIGSNSATNTISGTSMATPHVAGVLALHLSVAGPLSSANLKTWVTSAGTTGKVTSAGTGSPNILLYSSDQ